MNPELIPLYEKLVESANSELPDSWKRFKIDAAHDEAGLRLRLEYQDGNNKVIQYSPVPDSIFDVMEMIYEAAGPSQAWCGWVFEFNRTGKYSVNVKYPDSPPNA